MSETPAPAEQHPGQLTLSIPGKRGLSTSVLAPRVFIDGAPVEVRYGSNSVNLPAGQHHLAVHPRPSFTRSHASADIDVVPGQETRMYYNPPISTFGSGSVRTTPGMSQTLKAVTAFFISLVFFTVFVWAVSR